MVVKIASKAELLDPLIKERKSGSPLNRLEISLRKPVVVETLYTSAKGPPYLRTKLEPPFPIGAPQDLLYELLSYLKRMARAHGGYALLFSDNPIANPFG
jgi:hypothetical protein